MQDTKMDKQLVLVNYEDLERLHSLAMQSLLLNETAWLRMSWNDTEQRLQLQRIDSQGLLAQPVTFSTSKKLEE